MSSTTTTEQEQEREECLRKAIVNYRIKCDIRWSDKLEGVITQEEYESCIENELNHVLGLILQRDAQREADIRIDENNKTAAAVIESAEDTGNLVYDLRLNAESAWQIIASRNRELKVSLPSPKPRKEGGGMSKQPEAPDELGYILDCLASAMWDNGKHLAYGHKDEEIAKAKAHILAREERLAKKILDDLESEMNLHELSGSPDDSYIQGLNATCRVVQWVFDRKRKQLTNPIDKEKNT